MVLLGVPALPVPTGGVTHVFEIIAALLALQLIVGRDQIWLPQRWCALELAGPRQQRFLRSLISLIRRLERLSQPRLRFLFNHRLSNIIFGVLVLGGCAAAFLAPPFTGLDTLPALGVVLLSLGVLLEDIAHRPRSADRGRHGRRAGDLPRSCTDQRNRQSAVAPIRCHRSQTIGLPGAHVGSALPACSRTMYSAYQSGQFASYSPVRFSCSP